MPSITSWTRLNPRTRSEDFRTSIQAQVHDPLWFLARQWQLGEFQGEDGGAPVQARVRIEHAPLTRYHSGPLGSESSVTGRPYDARREPLETRVECEPIRPDAGERTNWRLAATTGLHFVRLLNANGAGKYRSAYLARYALSRPSAGERDTLDAESLRFLLVTTGRILDGDRLHRDLHASMRARPAALPAEPEIAEADREAVMRAATAWLDWCDSLFSEPDSDASAWISERMEYGFATSARTSGGEVVLTAPEYQEGHLDWYSFNTRPGASLGASGDAEPRIVTRTVIPTPVRYQGMPADRWWEFEDAQVFLGGIDVEPEDLSQLLFMEFALSYGSDWFIMPVELEVGAVHRVRSLVITDTFGERTLIRPYHEVDGPDTGWRMFCPCADWRSKAQSSEPPESMLLLPPALAGSLHGAPLEEVLLLRDEMANMAWAVERVVESPMGMPLNRFEAEKQMRQAAPEQPPPSPADGAPNAIYRLATRVPEYWTPLLPVKIEKDRPDIRLQRARLLRDRSGEAVAPQPLGRLLEPGRDLSLFEEEVPRAGARVTRTFQLARWMDGSTHLWIGRRKQPGRGEGWSGLRFDVVEERR